MTNHTDTSRSGDLVKRLREMGEHPCRSELPMGEDLRRAADRIDAREAEIDRLREELAAAYIELSDRTEHASDCATSNAPAMKPGPCDCAALSAKEPNP